MKKSHFALTIILSFTLACAAEKQELRPAVTVEPAKAPEPAEQKVLMSKPAPQKKYKAQKRNVRLRRSAERESSRIRHKKRPSSQMFMADQASGTYNYNVAPLSTIAPPHGRPPFNTEAYAHIRENGFQLAKDQPLSTFSIDVDTASYANVRRFLKRGQLPPKDAVRIEELINYFSYNYPKARGKHPFAVQVESASTPWNPQHRLVRIGVKAKEIDQRERQPSNLVFLLDVSGSMRSHNKLPLLKRGLKLLVEQLDRRDRVAIVVYAGASGVVLPSTSASNKQSILDALDRLQAGGSTNGGAGIQLAYDIAVRNFVNNGSNRVILATDGDFNVGISDHGSLTRLIEEKRKSGVFLSVLGFGMGNYKDSTLETLAQHGNGNYAYIDSILEARKTLVEQMGGTLFTVAKDVKIQVEFNPAQVQAYRLIGYENRMLRARDFNDDKKDAGEIGAGHSVTALYEIVPPGTKLNVPNIDPLKYQTPTSTRSNLEEMLTLKLRYKKPKGNKSTKLEYPVRDSGHDIAQASTDLRFAAAVANFGMLLRGSEHRGATSYQDVLKLARSALGQDKGAYRAEFLRLVEVARSLSQPSMPNPGIELSSLSH